jgi:hypothetical protein
MSMNVLLVVSAQWSVLFSAMDLYFIGIHEIKALD